MNPEIQALLDAKRDSWKATFKDAESHMYDPRVPARTRQKARDAVYLLDHPSDDLKDDIMSIYDYSGDCADALKSIGYRAFDGQPSAIGQLQGIRSTINRKHLINR
ncbi:MAG: hypothetical protein Q3986_06405 [Akkermansia sp.]|nr:hypothetical protein [Akkermansia sp.]